MIDSQLKMAQCLNSIKKVLPYGHQNASELFESRMYFRQVP